MKKALTTIFLLVSIFSYSQKEANFWYFGLNAGLDFSTDPPTAIAGSLATREGCSTFSDTDGNLLFYSDGKFVWNRHGDLMPNGIGLRGDDSSTQSAIIVPYPLTDNLFYIFTVGVGFGGGTPGLNAYLIDMNADGGNGDVVDGPIDLSPNDLKNVWSEKVTSVKGEECNTFWVISPALNSFYAYKVDKDGLNETPVTSTVDYNPTDIRGYLKASPDGTKLASATYNYGQTGTGSGRFMVYDFNDRTGRVDNQGLTLINQTQTDGEPYGVEFSPDSSKLYCSTRNDSNQNTIYQFNLSAPTNISGTKVEINQEPGYRGALQLAPNGKIYVTIPISYDVGTSHLDVINNPNEIGSASDFEDNAINLNGKSAMQGLPPFIASILLPIEINDNVETNENINNETVKRCSGQNYELTPKDIPGDNPIYEWTFNHSIISTQETLKINNLSDSNEGIYNLKITTKDDCGTDITYLGSVDVEVFDSPTISKPDDINYCDDDNDGFNTFDLTLNNTVALNGQDDTVFEVLYFSDLTDAENNENSISTFLNSSNYSADTVYVRVHNILNPLCYELESFVISVFETPTPLTTISDLTTCDSTTTGTDLDGIELFDLTLVNDEILNGQSTSKFTITYFTDASLNNSIPNVSAFENSQIDTQTIYYQITNNNFVDCEANGSFELIVYELPEINYNYTMKQCDEDGIADGFSDFNLEEANEFLVTNSDDFTITYHSTKNGAENKSDAVSHFPFSNQVQSKVFARIESEFGCFRVSEVDLLVSATSFSDDFIIEDASCDDDEILDGLRTFNLSDYDDLFINELPAGQNLNISYYRNLEDAQLELNEIGKNAPYLTEIPNEQIIFIRIESEDNGECFELGPYLKLEVYDRPDFELDTSAIYCENLDPIEVSIFNPTGDFEYVWKNESGAIVSTEAQAIISEGGNYSAVATSINGCESFPKTINILASKIASINYNDFTIVDDSTNNSITIDTANLGIGDYEFSIDDSLMDYQDEPYFENVVPGIHTIYIRDKYNCGVASIDISVIGFPKFFTPNNDGYNDTWQVLGVSKAFYKIANLNIFDRYGKLIAQIDINGNGWDGSFNGEQLPSTDYWYAVELEDLNGNKRSKKGHFSLIRR